MVVVVVQHRGESAALNKEAVPVISRCDQLLGRAEEDIDKEWIDQRILNRQLAAADLVLEDIRY